MKIFVRLLCLSSLSSGFVTQNPNRSARIRLTETYVATPLDCVKEGEKQKENNPRGPSKPKITTLDSAEDYIDFLSEDDRLCMVK